MTEADALSGITSEIAPKSIGGRPIGEVVRDFAKNLIDDRLRVDVIEGSRSTHDAPAAALGAPLSRPTVIPSADLQAWVFNLVVAAVLLTKLYFHIKAEGFDAPHRRDHSDKAFLKKTSRFSKALEEDYVGPCSRILESLKNRIPDIATAFAASHSAGFGQTLGELLFSIDEGLNPPQGEDTARVSVKDVHALAEFTWYCLGSVTNKNIYPGWSDLLLDLSNCDGLNDGGIGTPRIKDVTSVWEFIIGRYGEVTKQSWEAKITSHAGRDERFYSAVATLLNAQHEFRMKTLESTRPPVSTAFVASFDLEVEIALLSSGKPFTVALPVHVYNATHKLVHTCWLALRVEASSDRSSERLANALLRPPEDQNWRVLDAACGDEGPVVIRLAGCPLVQLPKLGRSSSLWTPLVENLFKEAFKTEAGGKELIIERILNGLQLQHAVLINEHDAMLQSATDLLWIHQSETEKKRLGLPVSFAAGKKEGGWSRFWMMLGVQTHDSAVRQRIATVISTLPFTEWEGSSSTENEERCGLAVNCHSNELVQDLLFWNGFDVVRGDVSAFTNELTHYAQHLGRSPVVFQKGGPCAF